MLLNASKRLTAGRISDFSYQSAIQSYCAYDLYALDILEYSLYTSTPKEVGCPTNGQPTSLRRN